MQARTAFTKTCEMKGHCGTRVVSRQTQDVVYVTHCMKGKYGPCEVASPVVNISHLKKSRKEYFCWDRAESASYAICNS